MPVKRVVQNFSAILFASLMLAACNTSNFGNGISSNTPSQNVGNADQQQLQTSENALVDGNLREPPPGQLEQSPTGNNQQLASLPSGPGITFLPVTGAPQRSVTTLSRSLKSAALNYDVNLIPSNASGANYRVKGYFSALDDGSGTLLVYVWDVLDARGSRLHRISGQQRTSSKSSNPWSSVSSTEIDRVAADTMARLRSWLANR